MDRNTDRHMGNWTNKLIDEQKDGLTGGRQASRKRIEKKGR
jgi:hypothetical protein